MNEDNMIEIGYDETPIDRYNHEVFMKRFFVPGIIWKLGFHLQEVEHD